MYKMLKRKNAINSPLRRINKPDVKEKKQIFKKLFFFEILKKK